MKGLISFFMIRDILVKPVHRASFLGTACLVGALAQAQGAGPSLFPQPLPIPPVLKPTSVTGGTVNYDLTAHAGLTSFFQGRATPTYGYNGMSYLGPTIRLLRGHRARITLHNLLPADGLAPVPMSMSGAAMDHAGVPNGTSLHLHGLVVASEADTTPSDCCMPLPPGQSQASAVFVPGQPSATLWYHPHPYLDTGRQVYMGLGGLLLVDDPAEALFKLPRTYGVDDLPVIVQDRRFAPDRSLLFRDRKEDEEGMLGNRILVNGVIAPHADVAATRIRLRLVNASNARAYLFAFRDGRSFDQIATDGGLLSAPTRVDEVMVPPAGRAEIVVDLSHDAGKAIHLVSNGFQAPAGRNSLSLPNGANFPVMEFRVGHPKPSPRLPARLAELPAPDERRATVTRTFELEKGGDEDAAGGDGTINGKRFDGARVDERVEAGAWEVWTVVNHSREIAHPFHVHGIQFRVLKRNSGSLAPNDQGWKDTVNVLPRETVRLLLHFDKQAGVYMYHCHNLEHEDMGMMGTYEVGE
ncbi:MAG TPA: multicopper oxidase domain-containing protein [Holophagaceae bacterium]|jgi:FtsP/CotA-like multicopper oxidase with cupredoxin domain|nr:multicopper oxidase domain-containing protein [Holophagaceae bacterium]